MSDIFVHSEATVSPHALIGAGTKIWNQAQIREGVVIGSGCNISRDVYIDRDVTIGNRVKIQNGVSVYRGVTVEDDVFIGPYASFTNDLRPRSFSSDWQLVPTLLSRGCSIGSNATILCGVTLGSYCMVSAGAVVTEDTLPFGLYVGNPARLTRFVGRNGQDLEIESESAFQWILVCPVTQERLTISFSNSTYPQAF